MHPGNRRGLQPAFLGDLDHRAAHRFPIGIYPEPASERECSLLEEHREAVDRAQAALSRRHHPRGAASPVNQIEYGCGPGDFPEIERMIIVVLAYRSGVHDQGGAGELDVYSLFRARDIRKFSGERCGSLRLARKDSHLSTRPLAYRRQNRRRRTPSAEEENSRVRDVISEQSAGCGIESTDVGIVSPKLSTCEPESVHRSDPRRELCQLITRIVDSDLVWDSDVASGVGFLQLLQSRAQAVWFNVQRFVDERNVRCLERSVLKNWRQRVGDRMAEQGKPTGVLLHDFLVSALKSIEEPLQLFLQHVSSVPISLEIAAVWVTDALVGGA